MIISGYRTFKRKKGVTKTIIHCDNCGMDSHWQLLNLWKWFTLFFIPLFPFHKKKVLVCPSCEYGVKVTKKNKEQIMNEIEDSTSVID